MDKARSCVYQANYRLIWVVKCRRKVFLGSVEVGFVGVLKMIAGRCDFVVFSAWVYDGDHVYVFVFALTKFGISDMVCLFMCNSDRVLFLEFSVLRLCLWGGYLWSGGYAVRIVGVVDSVKIEDYINRV
ncbi:MAG: IS200/IS605 family transposase [Candidatus Bathyarchaeota archaeon]|nr:IS200/IS605 family transposase [Candidatus Termiticorpusculum sp.]